MIWKLDYRTLTKESLEQLFSTRVMKTTMLLRCSGFSWHVSVQPKEN